jgi:hypothetical protein
MKPTEFRDDYLRGKITAGEFVVELVNLVDDKNVDEIMALLPQEVMPMVLRFLLGYVPGKSISFGGAPHPSTTSVDLVKTWLTRHPQALKNLI